MLYRLLEGIARSGGSLRYRVSSSIVRIVLQTRFKEATTPVSQCSLLTLLRTQPCPWLGLGPNPLTRPELFPRLGLGPNPALISALAVPQPSPCPHLKSSPYPKEPRNSSRSGGICRRVAVLATSIVATDAASTPAVVVRSASATRAATVAECASSTTSGSTWLQSGGRSEGCEPPPRVGWGGGVGGGGVPRLHTYHPPTPTTHLPSPRSHTHPSSGVDYLDQGLEGVHKGRLGDEERQGERQAGARQVRHVPHRKQQERWPPINAPPQNTM